MAEPREPIRKGGRPKLPGPKRSAVSLKGSSEWRDWHNELAAHCSMPSTVMIDQALKAYAKSNDFPRPMPPR